MAVSFAKCGVGRLPGTGGLFGRWQQPFALHLLFLQLAVAAYGFGFFANTLFRRLFIGFAGAHLAENAFTLHSLFQDAKGLFNIVVSDEYLQDYLL
jgi:hypothetical protein